MKRLALLAPTVALIVACGGSAVSLQPGQWETTVQFKSIEVPGAPEPMVAQMRTLMGQPQTNRDCMTPQEAANPSGGLVNPGGNANDCQFTENTFSGGTIRVRGNCTAAGRGTMQMSLEGSYTATTMEAQISTEVRPPAGTPGPQNIRMSGTMSGRRIGDCPAS